MGSMIVLTVPQFLAWTLLCAWVGVFVCWSNPHSQHVSTAMLMKGDWQLSHVFLGQCCLGHVSLTLMVIHGGIYEALELRDGEKRLLGKGVLQAEHSGRE